MSADIEKYLALLEERISLLRELAEELVACRREFVAMDLDGMYVHISAQGDLCRRIRSLGPAINTLHGCCAGELEQGQMDAASNPEESRQAGRFSRVMRELVESQAEVGRLNQIHAAYLRRSLRTVNVLKNFFGSFALTYVPHAGSSSPAPRITGGI